MDLFDIALQQLSRYKGVLMLDKRVSGTEGPIDLQSREHYLHVAEVTEFLR
jgi:hypothetical protein